MLNIFDPLYHNEEAARKHIEKIRWPYGPQCPRCGSARRVSCANKDLMRLGWYHCDSCRRKFSVRVGTIYERSHIPLRKWLYAIALLSLGTSPMSVRQLHRALGIAYRTARVMKARIRQAMKMVLPLRSGDSGACAAKMAFNAPNVSSPNKGRSSAHLC